MSMQGGVGVDLTARDLSGPAFASMEQKLKRLQEQTQGMGQAAGTAAGPVGVLGGAFGALQLDKAVDGMVAFHKAALAQVGTYKDLADRLGINVELYQAYRLVLKDYGLGQEELNGIIGRFNAKLGEAQNGGAAAIELFKKFGVHILDVNGKAKDAPVILTEVARALSSTETNAQRSAGGLAFFGKSGESLGPVLKALSTDADQLTEGFRKQGLIVDEHTAGTLKRLADASAANDEKLKAFYATVAAPLQAQGLEYLAGLMGDLTKRIRAANGDWVDMVNTMMGGNQSATFGGLKFDSEGVGARLQKMQDLQSKVDSFQKRLDDPRRGDAPRAQIEAARDKVKAELAALTSEAQAVDRASAQVATNAADLARLTGGEGAPGRDRYTAPAGRDPTPNGSGGGGGGARDRIGENLRQLQGERKAIETALGSLQNNVGMPLKEIERTVEVQKRIDDIVARMTKTDGGDKRASEIRQTATALEQARYGYQEYIRAINDAEAFEAKYGDGKRELAETQRRLTLANDTGRLSTEAYAFATREATFAAEQQRLTLVGQRGGLEGMAAGFQAAAGQYSHANSMFAQGGQLFQGIMQANMSAFTKWRQTGQFDMASWLGSWSDMLAQAGMQLLTSEFFKMVTGAGGSGGGGGLFSMLASLGISAFGSYFGGGNFGIGDVGGAYNGGGSLSFGGPRADGGPVDPSHWYMVGERGPEPFVPTSAGTIVPNAGGGTKIEQHFHISTGVAQTVRAEILSLMPSIASHTVAAVRDDRNRSGDRR